MVIAQKSSRIPLYCGVLSSAIAAMAALSVVFPQDWVVDIATTIKPYNGSLNSLFAHSKSPGVLAICAAEGNCILKPHQTKKYSVQYTSLYYGHIDPGNGVRNRGWCSDQGRGGANVKNADAGCLRRTLSRISRLAGRMNNVSVKPEQHPEAFVNAIDLWNQASPRVSDNFPRAYKKALDKGMSGFKAINWARIEAFRRSNGELEAGSSRVGLFSICLREPYYTSRLRKYRAFSEQWRRNCIGLDQSRRAREINKVFRLTLN